MAIKADKARNKDIRSRLKRGSQTPESGVLLLAVLSLLVLFNPFSEGLLAPALPFLAAFALFLTPGLVLALALLPEFSGLARAPVAFALSAGLFGLAALPELALSSGVTFYPIICAGILVLSLGFLVVRTIRGSAPANVDPAEEHPGTGLSTRLLWVPFSLFGGALAWISALSAPRPADDAWIYLSRVRDLLELGGLGDGGFSRLSVNGWLPELSMLSLASGLDPVDLVLRYLAPALILVSLLALYALARTLLQSEKAALVIGALVAFFILVAFGSVSFESVLAPGAEFANRITEDKFVARYVFLPVALSLAILFARNRSWRLLGLFFFVCLSAAVVHPLGLVFIGVCIVGFGLVQLAISWRDRGTRLGVGGLWLALLVIVGPPAVYLLVTGSPLLNRLDAANPETADNLIGAWQYERRLLEIGDGSYVMHPSILLDPAMLVTYLLGVPFLIWKIRRAGSDGLAARLLLGVLVFVPVLTFVPYVATYVATVIGPWLLHRLTWPLLLGALLTLGWMSWEVIRYVQSGLGEFDPARRVAPFLPLIVISFLLADATPLALTGLRAASAEGETAQDESTCLDPTFRWMQDAFAPGTLMAPRAESVCVTAYAASVDVLGSRGQISSRNRQSLEDFYAAPTLGPDAPRTLERYGVRYVVLPVNSPLNAQLGHLPGFERMDNPGERYRVYEVTDQQRAFDQSPPVLANGEFNAGEWDAAIEAYTEVLEDGANDNRQFLAYLGLGLAYTEQERYTEAVESYQTALQLDPESATVHNLLAVVHGSAGETAQARTQFERAVELDPRNAALRLRYGQFLATVDRRAAVEQHQAVVETYPKVPEYRIRLGSALLLAGAPEAADAQFERVVRLDPLSARLRADIGGANLAAGRPERALLHYENALDLDPNSQLYALNLGRAHAQLEHFQEAERFLQSVEELGYRPWEEDQRGAAQIALGDLYVEWDRPQDAATAYERALELNPEEAP